MLPALELSPDAKQYHYLKGSNCIQIKDVDDKQEFDEVFCAMGVIGASDTRRMEIFQGIAAVLHLGNISFASGDGDVAVIAAPDSLAKAAARLPDALVLTTRELKDRAAAAQSPRASRSLPRSAAATRRRPSL